MRVLLTALFLFTFAYTFSQTGVISASKEKGCVPFNVNFSYSLNNVSSYQWDFGNGNTSTVSSPTILFDTPGSFSVKLTAVQNDGQVKTISFSKNIEAITNPVASFSTSATSFCINTVVSFDNTSIGGKIFLWDFGDGSTSNLKNPQHIYLEEGTYTVSLLVYNELNCFDVDTKNEFIDIGIVAPLEITVDKNEKCIDNPLFFFTTTSGFKSYTWNFGDGNTSNQFSPSHTYNNAGTYTITLQAVTNDGCLYTKSEENYITVADLIIPTLESSETVVCKGGEIFFSGTFETNDSVKWEFSDGFITNEKQFSRIFNNQGNYSYTVKTTNPSGCSATTSSNTDIKVINVANPIIDFGTTKGCTPFKVSLANNTPDVVSTEWEIDGMKLSGNAVQYEIVKAGKYSLKAWLEYKTGCTKLITYDSIYEAYSAENEIIVSSFVGCTPLQVDVQLKNSNVTNINWVVGNQVSNKLKPTFEFNSPGEYSISVTFKNEYGCKQNLLLNVPIKVYSNEIDYAPPSTIFTCQSTEVFFNGGIGKDFWQWDFGDGTYSNESNPSHYYENTGAYTVLLKTNNIYGCESEEIKYNEIVVNNLIANITSSIVDTTKGCPNFSVQFNSNSSSGSSCFWEFGNGSTSSESNPRIDFATNGQLNTKLTVMDGNGCSYSTYKIINSPWLFCRSDDGDSDVPDIPDSVFFRKHTIRLCNSPATVQFSNPRLQAKSWLWRFGDNTTSVEREVTHTYNDQGIYFVDLISYYADGNIDTLDNFIEVIIEKPNVNFSFTQRYNCGAYDLNFSNNLESAVEWLWEFGDGSISNEKSPTHAFSKPGVYQVSLSAVNDYGCQSKVIKNIIVGNQYLVFDYESKLCEDDVLAISHNLQGFNKYKWDFGDGMISMDKFPTHSYQNTGIYKISVEAFGKNGCSQTFLLPNSVQYSVPKADFSVDNDSGCNTQQVKFTNMSNNADDYYWLFGESANSTQENPQFEFESGNFDITLIASKGICKDTLKIKKLIEIDSIVADFEFVKERNCLPTEVSFTNKSVNTNNWKWDFGDGNTSMKKNPVHLYETMPAKAISLTVTNSNGCKATTSKTLGGTLSVDFDVSDNVVCRGQEITFINKSQYTIRNEWDFGDGTKATIMSPKHSYKNSGYYNVKLTVTGSDGCTIEKVKQKIIKVNRVQPDFTIKDNNTGCAPLLVSFENKTIDATEFHWEFGDNSSSSNKNPIHIYNKIGQYNVTLIAIDSIGCSDTLLVENSVRATGPDSKITPSDSIVCHPNAINFIDESKNAVSWEWIFGDGNISRDKNPEHTYQSPGIYNVSLLATDADGCEQFSRFDSVRVISTPEVLIDVIKESFCLPVEIKTINNSTGLQNATYQWSFGDGNTSDQIAPKHLYTVTGEFLIELVVTNEGRCVNSAQLQESIIVYDTTFISQPEIFRLSVANNSLIEVNCDPYLENNFKYNVVYRKSENENEFIPYDTLKVATARIYTDSKVEAEMNSYGYIFQSHAYCHDPMGIDQLNQYKSIHVKSNIQNDNVELKWTHYKGHRFDNYLISRRNENSDWLDIAVVPNTKDQFIDDEDLCPGKYNYRIQATNLEGSHQNSESNLTEIEVIKNVFLDQHVDIVRTTVTDDRYIYTEWKEPEIGSDKVVYYEVLRGVSNDFIVVDQVPAGITSYYDEDVDIQTVSYTYKIRVVNVCDIETQLSNIGKSILLQKETDNYKSRIYWTPYEGWSDGVGKYKLQKLNDFGEWETVQELDSLKFETVIDLSNKD